MNKKYILRKWQKSDLYSLVKHANNRNIAEKLTNKFPFPYTEKDGKDFLESVIHQDSPLVFAIEIAGEAVGAIGLFPQEDIHCKNAEMGYWLSESYWGNGIMPEAIKEMVRYGFSIFDINRIFARPFGTNLASRRVLEKAGFKQEAVFKDTLYKNGKYIDEIIYAIRKTNMMKKDTDTFRIRPLEKEEEIPFSLLYLADPSEVAVKDYLKRGRCYAGYLNGELIGEYVLLPTRPFTIELINLAVDERFHKKGFGKQLVLHAIETAKNENYQVIEVGTGNAGIGQLALYQKCGFTMYSIDLDFFSSHYLEPMYENGIECKHMVRMKIDL
ncbi:MAG: GNAT family N-acetyltransferase [Candidatus Azobacteroides sp.]|nr:GNAT family N-acetyltransferase [Candidatus Azobacteroides sp.]